MTYLCAFKSLLSLRLNAFLVLTLFFTAYSSATYSENTVFLDGGSGLFEAASTEPAPASPLVLAMAPAPTRAVSTKSSINYPPVITGTSTASIGEDTDWDSDNLLELRRTLNISDKNPGESAFKAATRKGKVGTLTIKASGEWFYKANKNQLAIQSLGSGKTLVEKFIVSTIDGTKKTITIKIIGANDKAIINGVSNGTVTKNVDPDGDNLLEVSRTLRVDDIDAGESALKARSMKGKYGTLNVFANGRWKYSARNDQAPIQSLSTGKQLTERLRVSSVDGTTKAVVIQIQGKNSGNTKDTNTSTNGNGQITLTWVAPAAREDGSALSMAEISGYNVYYGNSPGNYPNRVSIKKSSTMRATLSNLASGTYYIVVTTVDSDGRESAYSSEAIRRI